VASNIGDVPFNQLAYLGGQTKMRGVFEGYFRDKNLVLLQTEIRQEVWKVFGLVAFSSLGFLGNQSDLIRFNKPKYTYGGGLRIATKNHLKGYCLRCFIYNFPNDKIVRDYGTREAKVSQFIKNTYTNLKITYNKIIDGGCSKNRPDIFIDCLTHSIIIEVDEHQHKQKVYTPECEISRINNLFTDLADRPIVFIRFNPDSYTNKNNKLIKSCFEYTEDRGLPKANKKLQTRLKKLKKLIDVNLNKVPTENITTIKLYYDGF
jgi:hypothetical protein